MKILWIEYFVIHWDIGYADKYILTFLYREATKYAHSSGYTHFDFGRTDPDNKTLMDYKSRWGTIVSDLPVYVYPAPAEKKSKNSKNSAIGLLLRKIVFELPDPVYTMVSNFCYRHNG